MAIALSAITATLPLAQATAPFAPSAPSASYPPLNLSFDRAFLSNLSAPDLAPGASGTLSFEVADPTTFVPVSAITVGLEVYAFNAFPGNATSSLASLGVPVLVTSTTSSTVANLSLGSLSPGDREAGSVGVATAASTPTGAYAVRTMISFSAKGTEYRLESRGYFTESAWEAATELPNGSVSITNRSFALLGVSGITPETAIEVSSSSWDWALVGILGASLVLVGAGAFVYFRRESKSSSGAR
jgi:hypothetical protein